MAFDVATAIAALPFSSGTTGLPKEVMLTHRNLIADLEQIANVRRVTQNDVVVAALPFFHIYGFTVGLSYTLKAAQPS